MRCAGTWVSIRMRIATAVRMQIGVVEGTMKMQIVIDVPDEAYNILLTEQKLPHDLDFEYLIMHGIPLPKGHGRILDEKDILDTENNEGGWYDLVDMPEYIAGVKPIVEADTENEDNT